ncbi:Zn(2)-C6 fungal-type DNA-binding domain [Penicillium roqueforti FM164]|uniref:Fungal transcriptional regulatory protein, N-terminal n=3 Tax=Penicillium TaxID=5073 RepID=A0A0G4PYR3_PENC3|nr:Zn(2)-C6 fungal-type DNA-binding domain [Penicillium roqueforti FM164]CRL31531.1 Fungal transcriptional regulatory protein, N-terminal [Penicillium camemberti]
MSPLASCEPCRKDKVRCDHAQPVCKRCQKRGFTGRCFYHPAPLTSTRRQPDRDGQIHLSPSPSLGNLGNPMSDSETLDAVAPCPSVIQPALRTEQMLPAGYLGPTSFIAGLEESVDLFTHGEQSNTDGRENSAIAPSPALVKRTAEVLRCLQHFPAIKNLVHKYYSVSQTAVIPSPFILNALDELEVTVNGSLFGSASDERLFTFSTFVTHNTSKALQIPQNSDGTVFHKYFTGPFLRLEIIGVICALAGRASYFGLADSTVGDTESPTQFSRKMLVICDLTIHICKSLTALNDLSLWLVHENLLLSKLLRGDSSSVTWNRLGELATGIFEFGAHRDTPSLVPLFILESRRRLFAASYQLDKSIATFLGRPPRISWRHSDCLLPLDISDEDLAGHPHTLEAARRSLDANGWNIKKVYQPASWIRLRFIISTFREEILELSLQKLSPNRTEKLREVSSRCHQAWGLLPEHLQYTSSCWESDLPIGVKLISIISYIAYLYNEFSIQSLLYQDSKRTDSALLDVSSEILSTILTLGRQWERSVDIKGDFTWIALVYGFSCAGVLIRAMQEQARTGQPLLYSGSRSSLIRNLSVFISHLESMAGPEQATSPLFIRATSVFSSIIDGILEPRREVPVNSTNPDTILNSDIETPFLFDLQGMDLFETQDFRVAFDDMLY